MKKHDYVPLTVCVVAAATALVITIGASASAAHRVTKVTRTDQLRVFTTRAHVLRSSALPSSASEVAQRLGADTTTAQEVLSGASSIYLLHKGTRELCTIIVVNHAGGSCDSQLRDAGGSLRAMLSIVDGELFVWGLAANNVTSVNVSVAGSKWAVPASGSDAALAGNVFLISLPYSGGGLGAVTVTASRVDGSTSVARIPAVPAPPNG